MLSKRRRPSLARRACPRSHPLPLPAPSTRRRPRPAPSPPRRLPPAPARALVGAGAARVAPLAWRVRRGGVESGRRSAAVRRGRVAMLTAGSTCVAPGHGPPLMRGGAGAPCRRPSSTRASTPSAATTAGPPPIHPHPPPRPARRCAPLGARGPAVGAGGVWSRRGAQGAVGVDWGRERRGGGEAADLEACPTRAVVPSLRQPLPQRSALVTCRVPA